MLLPATKTTKQMVLETTLYIQSFIGAQNFLALPGALILIAMLACYLSTILLCGSETVSKLSKSSQSCPKFVTKLLQSCPGVVSNLVETACLGTPWHQLDTILSTLGGPSSTHLWTKFLPNGHHLISLRWTDARRPSEKISYDGKWTSKTLQKYPSW